MPINRTLLVLLALPLAGCGSIFDPAPYNPGNDPAVLNSLTPPADSVTILTFGNPPSDARAKLQALAAGYAGHRDALMRQQLLFDIPMIGLGAAAIVNPLFEGGKNVTLGLGLGAAGMEGGRLYFAPQAREAAYNAAWLSLSCAALVADGIVAEKKGDGLAGPALADRLESEIAAAEGSISSDPVLLAAYNQAQQSLAALKTALAALSGATGQLEQYALSVISAATNKIVGNIQNVSAAVGAIAAAAKPAPPASVTPHVAAARGPQPQRELQQLTLDLQNDAAKAEVMTQRINAVLAALPKCNPS